LKEFGMSTTVIRNKPVAKFRYKGSHSKPVRRTVLLTELSRNVIKGFEVREGNEVRDESEEVIKSYSREKLVDFERLSITDGEPW